MIGSFRSDFFSHMKKTRFIFDLDGTLYPYKGGSDFATSDFYRAIKKNIFSFLEHNLSIPATDVEATYQRIKQQYGGHVSLGIEQEFSIPRARFFEATWRLEPERYIDFNPDAHVVLSALSGHAAVLTEAPRVWAQSALEFLGVYEYVQNCLFTGEPDIRKPSAEVFLQVRETLGVSSSEIYSVGDQEESDILRAKEAGLRTIRIGGDKTAADFHIRRLRDLLDLPIDF